MGFDPESSFLKESDGRFFTYPLNYKYKSWVGSSHFFQPTLRDDKLVVYEYLYTEASADDIAKYTRDGKHLDPSLPWFQVRASDAVLQGPRAIAYTQNFGSGAQNVYYYPLKTNLEIVYNLPLIPVEVKVKLLELLWKRQRWMQVAFEASVLKASSVPVGDNTIYKAPVITETVEKVTTREPTLLEQIDLMTGVPVNLSSTETISTTRQHECVELQKYCDKKRMFSQQLIAAWAILQVQKIALWMDMRTGKTLSAIIAAKKAIHDGDAACVFVVCPVPNLYSPWSEELKLEGFDVRVLDGTVAEDETLILERAYDGHGLTAYICSYERLGSRMDFIREYIDVDSLFLIADETSAIKNPLSKRSNALRRFAFYCKYVVLLNGTPIEQGPEDLWAQSICIDPEGIVWDREYTQFQSEWLYEKEMGKFAVKNYRRVEFEVMVSAACSIRLIRSEADQFTGKDKTFRHIALPPTMQIFQQTKQVLDSYLEVTRSDGTIMVTTMNDVKIRTYGFLREIASSYGKYRDYEGAPYTRVPHKHDPKILWIMSYISANPTQPLVIYPLWNEQEHRLKVALNSLNIKWASLKPMMKEVTSDMLKESDEYLYSFLKNLYANQPAYWLEFFRLNNDEEFVTYLRVVAGLQPEEIGSVIARIHAHRELQYVDVVPAWMVYNKTIIEDVRRQDHKLVITYKSYEDAGTYSSAQQDYQRGLFNSGKVHVFICKMTQARGFSLARTEALEQGIGTTPAIISMGPPWSLGVWEQALDRCVASDKVTGKSFNTMVYSLSIGGTIEQMILKALRAKKEVQETILKDIERMGHDSFATALLEEMQKSMDGADKIFDHQEMSARFVLGINPHVKLTESLLNNKVKDKFGGFIKRRYDKVTVETIVKWIDSLPTKLYATDDDNEIHESYYYLLNKIKGTILTPDKLAGRILSIGYNYGSKS